MTPMLERQVTIAINTLKAVGAVYCIKLPDGRVMGDPADLEPKDSKAKRLPKGSLQRAYGPAVDAMQPGQCITLSPPEGCNPQSFRSAAAGHGIRSFGRGSMRSELCPDGSTTLIRVI
jgi:hypothetical protein